MQATQQMGRLKINYCYNFIPYFFGEIDIYYTYIYVSNIHI